MYSARNFLEARNVTSDPMKNINAAHDLLEKYTKALVLSAAMDFFGLEDFEGEPTRNIFSLEIHHNYKHYAEVVMSSFVDAYMFPRESEMIPANQSWNCSQCSKKYASRKTLMNHVKSKHSGVDVLSDNAAAPASNTAQDHILNYSRCALGLGMLALDFNDARQLGDGDRIIRLHKILLLHFKAARKPKYSFQVLRLLAQVKCFLTPRLSYELVWNRFVNTSGEMRGNVEVDRALEHRNRVFQENCQGLRGKITQKSVTRISRSVQQLHQVLVNVDKQVKVRKASSRRHLTGKPDVVALAKEFHEARIFEESANRSHSRFPNFPVSFLSTLHVPELQKWILASLKSLSRKNQFAVN